MLGRVIEGKYRLQRELGSGGMGLVYLARHETIERSVAIKVLHQELASDEAVRRRFETEAKAIARLRHPNCVMLYEFGYSDTLDALFAIFEYVEGASLEACVGTPLPISDVLEVGRQVSNGIAHAHENKIIHRDLKPENIMVLSGSQRLELKVLDFGIARIAEDDEKRTRLTQVGEMFGTPPYMSPEQVRAKLNVTPATDIYAIGVILYELLEGELPFLGETPIETVMMHLNDEVPPFEREGIPEELQQIVMRCLAKDADERFDSCADLCAALDAIEWKDGEASILRELAVASQAEKASADEGAEVSDEAIASAPTLLPGETDEDSADPGNEGTGEAEVEDKDGETSTEEPESGRASASKRQPVEDDEEHGRISTIAPQKSKKNFVVVAGLALLTVVLLSGGLVFVLASDDQQISTADGEGAEAPADNSAEELVAEEPRERVVTRSEDDEDQRSDEDRAEEELAAETASDVTDDEEMDEDEPTEDERATDEAGVETDEAVGASPSVAGGAGHEPTPEPEPEPEPTPDPVGIDADEDEPDRQPDGIRLDRRRRADDAEEDEEEAQQDIEEPAGIGLPPRD